MLDHTTTEVLKLIIRAKDESQRTLEESAKRVGGLRGHVAGLGQGMMTAGLGIGGAVAAIAGGSLKMASDFESTMSGVAAVSGATATEMKSLSALALQLGKDTSFSATEAGKGLEELVKGGVSIPDIMNGAAKATLNLAAAGGVDLPTAAEIASNAANQFGIGGKGMAHVADLIAGAANASSLSVSDFKFSMGAAGAVAHQLGFSFDDLSVAIAEMGAAGIKGSDAGTSLKTLFATLSPQTDKAAAMMQKLGLWTQKGGSAFFDAHGKVRSLAEVQGILHKALSGLTKEQQLNATHVMFGTDAMRAAAILAGQGASGYERMAASMGKVTAQSVAAKRLDNLKGQLEQLKGSFETLGITIGLALIPPAIKVAKALTGLVNKAIDFAKAHPGLIKLGIALAGIASVALTVGGAVALIVGVMNPIGLAVTGIVAAVGLLGTAWAMNWGGIRDKTKAAWASIKPAIAQIGSAMAAVGKAFKAHGIAGAAKEMLAQAGRLLGHLWSWITGTALPALERAVQKWAPVFWAWVQRVTPPVLSALGDMLGRLGGWITGTAWPWIARHVGRWAEAFWGWVKDVTPPLLATLGEMLGRLGGWIIGTALPWLGRHLGTWVHAFWDWVKNVTPPLLAQLGALLGKLGAWIVGTALPWLGRHVGRWAHAFWEWVKDVAPRLWARLGDLLGRLGNWIWNTALPAIGTKLLGWATAFWHWIEVAGPKMVGKLGELLGKMVVWIPVAAVALVAKLVAWGAAFIGWILPRLPGLIANLATFLAKIGQWILTKALPGLLKFGWDMGTSLLGGMAKGIGDATGQVIDAMTGSQKKIEHHTRKITKTKSPSLVYAAIGRDLMAGVALGIMQATPQVAAAAAQAGAHAGQHLVHAHHVAPHRVAGYTTKTGHYVAPHMVRGYDVKEHWAKNPTHAALSAAAAGGAVRSATAGAVRAGVQLVALVSRGGSPLEPLPVTIVSAAGRAATLAGGAVAVAPAAVASGAAEPSGGTPGAGGTWGPVPAAPRSRLTFGPHPHPVPQLTSMHVEVHVHDGAVQVGGGAALQGTGQDWIAQGIAAAASALDELAQSQKRSSVPANRNLPGAI